MCLQYRVWHRFKLKQRVNPKLISLATKKIRPISVSVLSLLPSLSTALKQLVVKFPCGSWLPECWYGHLPPGRSHTWERQKQNIVEIWNIVWKCLIEPKAFFMQLRLCCLVLYSHKEETCAHMVRYRTHPNVPMFMKVLWGYYCPDTRTTFIKLCHKISPSVLSNHSSL